MDEFIFRALLGGIGLAIISGPLGCLVIWQRMAFFGAALSHAALLGVALGLLFSMHLQLTILFICLLVSVFLVILTKHINLGLDTLLAILAHGSLALGILMIGLIPSVRIDLMAYLFGDILSIQWIDVFIVYAGGAITLLVLYKIWTPLLSLIIQQDLALVDGVSEDKTRLIFLLLLSFVVAISIHIVGVLLVVSMLIIPAACARSFSRSPEQMSLFAAIIGCTSIIFGLLLSFHLDTAAGPSIVVSASIIFLIIISVSNIKNSFQY